jgi:hypothetical protein
MACASFDAPSSEFSRIKDLLTTHNATYISRVNDKDGGNSQPNAAPVATTSAPTGGNIRLLLSVIFSCFKVI